MTIKEILQMLEPKRQNMPELVFDASGRTCTILFVPVTEGEEKAIKKEFRFPLFKDLSGKKGEKMMLVRNNQIQWFIGIGPKKDVNSRVMRRFFGTWYSSGVNAKPKSIGFYCPVEFVKEAAIGIRVAALSAGLMKSKPKITPAPKVMLVNREFSARKAEAKLSLKQGLAVAEGKNLMRVLGGLPANVIHPQSYAEVIVELAKKWGVECKRLTQKELEPYGLINAVSSGSIHPSEMLILTVHPESGPTKTSVAVVGKGLCFDSGGLQDKQMYMKFMKEDMAGSAAALGTILAIQKGGLELKETTHFALGISESLMGEKAMRPDDIYVAGDGQTVEIVHTDAEGRLVLADTICYLKKNHKNIRRYVTIATLTGSCKMAFDDLYTGMVVNNENFSKEMMDTGKAVGEYVYPAPFDMDYDDNTPPNADIANLGEMDRGGGWIKGGLFLYRFIHKAKDENKQAEFCHLDLGGTIDMKDSGKPWRARGLNSGVGVGLLTKLLTK